MQRLALLFFLTLSLLAAAVPLSAQRLRDEPAGLPQRAVEHHGAEDNRLAVLRDSVAPSRWKEGAAIGGVVGVLLGVVINHVAYETGDDPDRSANLGLVLTSAFVFALIGGVIGSGVHR